jgi:hypothetical protein
MLKTPSLERRLNVTKEYSFANTIESQFFLFNLYALIIKKINYVSLQSKS